MDEFVYIKYLADSMINYLHIVLFNNITPSCCSLVDAVSGYPKRICSSSVSSYAQLSWDPLSWCGRLSHSDAALEEDLASQALEESSSFLCSE
jgi:hypothetical protein